MEPGALILLPPPNNIAVGEFTVLIGMGGGGGCPGLSRFTLSVATPALRRSRVRWVTRGNTTWM
jgi:hypothetical protein